MKTIHSNLMTMFDVDETLLKWRPVTEKTKDAVRINYDSGKTVWLLPHFTHVSQLKAHKLRGHTIVVWSAGGAEWAAVAVKVLELEDYVDYCMAKPTWAYDDKPHSEYMPKSDWMEEPTWRTN